MIIDDESDFVCNVDILCFDRMVSVSWCAKAHLEITLYLSLTEL